MPDSIRKLALDQIKTSILSANGSPNYNNTIVAGQVVVGRLQHWAVVKEFPKVFILAGSESGSHLPGYQEQQSLPVSVVGYVESGDDASDKIEDLIFDLRKSVLSDPTLNEKVDLVTLDSVRVVGQYEDTGRIMICHIGLTLKYQHHKDTPQTQTV